MDVPVTEDQIRSLAYQLWEEAGSPDGRSDEFWILAQTQLASGPKVGMHETRAGDDDPAIPK
ncbi:hypothetical protein CR51_08665 [Caballeronia megalochromosomata]|nr:hypothetical protein CR51_08665 [Caballeronia megalochromosomata]